MVIRYLRYVHDISDISKLIKNSVFEQLKYEKKILTLF